MEINLIDFLGTAFSNIYNVFKFLLSSFVNGIDFYFAMFMNIPDQLNELFNSLPHFFAVGLSAVAGLMFLVLLIKLLLLVLLK